MISFESVSKAYRLGWNRKTVLDKATFSVPRGQSMAIIGVNGAGKSTLLRLMAGTSLPDGGYVRRGNVRVSFPLGFAGSFNAELTGLENVRFASRVYRCSIPKVTQFVQDFSDLGKHIRMPVRTYSSGMKARLSFGLSMALEFDVYLVDEVTAVGDANFQKRCAEVFDERCKHADVIMASHSNETLKKFCDTSCVLNGGQLKFYPSVEAGLSAYAEILEQ